MRLLRFIGWITSVLIFVTWLASCTNSEYTKLVKSELAKGVRMDSVFCGIRLGDSRAQYEELCLKMNRERLFTMGPMGSVQYLFVDSIFHNKPQEIRVLIDPSFDDENKIPDVNLEFSYPGWAPWNRELAADSLIRTVQKMLLKWYSGNPFVIAHPGGKVLPVKVDGNRRILLYRKDDQSVLVKIQDLLHPWYRNSTQDDEGKSERK